MQSTAERNRSHMAKGPGRPKGSFKEDSRKNDGLVRIDRSLITMAKVLAGYRGVSVPVLLTELLRPAMERAYAQMVREIGTK
jgi:hypothetical protein